MASHLIVFDLDGTLIDSWRDLAASTNEMLAGYGATALPESDIVGMIGEGARLLVSRALLAAGLDPPIDEALARALAIYDRRLLDSTRPYDGVPEVLDRLRGRALLAVLTNKPEAPTHRLLRALDLAHHFWAVVGGDGAFPRKPDPAALEHLMQAAGADASATLLVGDSDIDVATARRGGVRLCLAAYGFGRTRGGVALGPADTIAARPADIGSAADRLLRPGRSA